MGLLVYVKLTSYFIACEVYLLLINSHFLAQVVTTARSNSISHGSYYLGFLLLRVAIPIYFRAYHNNFLHLQPRDIGTFLIVVFAQVPLRSDGR